MLTYFTEAWPNWGWKSIYKKAGFPSMNTLCNLILISNSWSLIKSPTFRFNSMSFWPLEKTNGFWWFGPTWPDESHFYLFCSFVGFLHHVNLLHWSWSINLRKLCVVLIQSYSKHNLIQNSALYIDFTQLLYRISVTKEASRAELTILSISAIYLLV